MATLYETAVIGLTEFIEPMNSYYLQSDEPRNLDLYRINKDDFSAFLDDNPLYWKHIAIIISHINNLSVMRDMHLNTQLAWNTLRGKLFELMMLSEDVRNKHTIIDYVCERTSLSRGTVLTMLRELKRGKYIETNNGRLISVKS